MYLQTVTNQRIRHCREVRSRGKCYVQALYGNDRYAQIINLSMYIYM